MGLIAVPILINDRIYHKMRQDIRDGKVNDLHSSEDWQQYYRERFGLEIDSSTQSFYFPSMTEENYCHYLLRWT